MQRRIEFTPAFDNSRDAGHEGIGPATVRFIVVGTDGAVQFTLLTGWFHNAVRAELVDQIRATGDVDQALNTFQPMPGEVVVYSRTKRHTPEEFAYPGENPLGQDMVWQQGISAIDGRKLYDNLLWEGEEGVFKVLEAEYAIHF